MEENLSSANKAEATLADIPFKPKKNKKKNLRANEVIRSPRLQNTHTHAQKVQSLVKWNNLSTQNRYNKGRQNLLSRKKKLLGRAHSQNTHKKKSFFFARQAIRGH